MDSKRYVREFLRSHQGVAYSAPELAMEVNEYDNFELSVEVNAEEVLADCLELVDEEENIQHRTSREAQIVILEGEHTTLYRDDEYLKFDVVAEYAPDRLDEVEDLSADELIDWIVDELAEEDIQADFQSEFIWEEGGWG